MKWMSWAEEVRKVVDSPIRMQMQPEDDPDLPGWFVSRDFCTLQ